MPALDANIANIRAAGYKAFVYMSAPSETVIFRALVNQTTFTYPLTSLTFDNVTVGAFGDIVEGEEVIIYNQSSSTIKGRLRVRPGAATSTVLQVEEFSKGRLSIANNDKIEVLRSFRLRTRMVGATSAFNKDFNVVVSDNTSNPAPVCNSGGHWAGFTDAGQTYATVQFTGSTSFNTDPDSGATVTHSWTFPSGTPSSSTSANPSVQFPVGEYWVTHVATDASNSKTSTQYIWVRVHNRTTAFPTNITIESYDASIEGGWTARVNVPAGSTMPDGSLVVLWAEEYRNGALANYGSNTSGRSHIKLVGYAFRDDTQTDVNSGTVTFEVLSPVALLAQLPGFSQVIQRRASPTTWQHLKGLTTTRAFVYLLRWHTTLLTVHDFVVNATTYNYPSLYLQAQTPDAQVREIAAGIGAVFTCDRSGQCMINPDLSLASSATRTAATTTLSLTNADVIEISAERPHRYQYKQIEGRGFTAVASAKNLQGLLSITPGTAPAEAPQSTTVERLIVTDQADLNSRTGWQFAKQNRLSFGLPVSDITLELRGSFDVFDLYAEWVKLTLAASYSKRGISYSSTRFQTEAINVTFDEDNNSRVRLTLKQETDGDAGTTKKMPNKSENGLPAVQLPSVDFQYFPAPTYTGISVNVGTMALLGSNGHLYITSDFNTGEPVWTDITLSVTGTVLAFMVDAFCTKYTSNPTSGTVDGWILTTTNIYRITDIFAVSGRAVSSQLAFGYSTGLRNMHATRRTQNFLMAASNRLGSGGVYVHYTVDGTSWTTVNISSHYNTTTTGLIRGDEGTPGIWISEQAGREGTAYVGAYTATGAAQSATAAIFKTVDYGVNWVQTNLVTGMAQWPFRGLYLPFNDNADDGTMYFCDNDTATTIVQARLNADGTVSTIDPIAGANKGATAEPNFGIAAHPLNRQRMIACIKRPSGSEYGQAPYVSRDGGDTWTQIDDEIFTGDGQWFAAYCDGNNQDTFYLLGQSSKVAVSYDFGRTLLDRSGDLPAGLTFKALIGN